MLQHLLIGMVAPLGQVLGAPVTLALRSVTTPQARRIARLLRSRPLHLVANPLVALLLNVGGMVVLYATPLYRLTTADPTAHQLVHLHFLAAGCLFAWVIAGPDPAPRRPSVPIRLVVLGAAVAIHSTVAQLLYAGLLGDVAEILLALPWSAGGGLRVPDRPASAAASGRVLRGGA